MGSVVVSDVGLNPFSHGMFGAGHHHPPQDSHSSPFHASSRFDTPMTDAVSPSSSSSARSTRSRPPQYTSSARSSSSATPTAAQHHSRPAASPRLRQQSSANNPNFNYASSSTPSSANPSPSPSVRSVVPPVPQSPNRIKVRSLSHIQSFANDAFSPLSRSRSSSGRPRRDASDAGPQYEISEMPVSDVIEMVAGLLTKITTTNDRQHEQIHRHIPPPEGTAALSQQTNSVLAFHGKNVPQISILSYLSRIHKYCPTTYEVFLSLLVYFDRMTERVNSGPMKTMKRHSESSRAAAASSCGREKSDEESSGHGATPTPPPSGSLGKPAETAGAAEGGPPPSPPEPDSMDVDDLNLSHFFVVDSYNIHRLVIAGVTCASKFFSDIFYTNSRYAKVS